ncbi:unnamed protein product [Effrenium voratum]|uniref:Uncharacterized protein n=1 Tax=Effrenium voratum TaxID=2562239 RepID=A0AA36J0A5_9DINO|nr:unnamed protein product [Effrenium voratum]
MTRKSSPAEVSEEELAKARAEIEAVENRLRPTARSSKSEPESAEEELAKTRAEIEKTEEDLRRCEKEGAQHSPQKPQKAGISREARIGVLHPGSPVPCGTPITPAPGYNLAAAIANATNSGKAEPDTRPVPPPPPLDQMGVFVRGAPLSSLELPVPPPPPLALPPLDPRIQGPRAVPESPMGGARGRTPCRGASRTPYRGPQPESPYRGARSRTPYRGHVPDSPAGARSRTPGRGYRSPTRGRSVGRSGTPARGSCESPARAPPQAPPKIPVPPLWEKVMVVLVQAMRLDQETIDLLQTIPLEKAAELCVAAHGDRNPSEHIRHAMSQVMLAAAEMDTDPVKDVYQALDSKAQQMLSQLPSDEAQRALQKASRAQCASAFVVGYARRYWKEQNGEEWKRW